MQEEKLLTTKEVAEKLNVTVRRVQALIKNGRLEARKLGRDYIVRESELETVKSRKSGRPKIIR